MIKRDQVCVHVHVWVCAHPSFEINPNTLASSSNLRIDFSNYVGEGNSEEVSAHSLAGSWCCLHSWRWRDGRKSNRRRVEASVVQLVWMEGGRKTGFSGLLKHFSLGRLSATRWWTIMLTAGAGIKTCDQASQRRTSAFCKNDSRRLFTAAE